MKTFIQEFVQIVNQFPNQIAIQDIENEVCLSYKQLFSISQNLALKLEFEQKPILICSKSNWKLVVGILAVWMSRNYFLIIDNNYPRDRLANIIEILQPKYALCDNDCLINLNDLNKIYIENNSDSSSKFAIFKNYLLYDKAYVVFTSGSSGKPKGILITHEGILNVLKYQKEKFELSFNSKVLHYLNPSFDAFISELGTTLLTGACFVIHSKVRENILLLQNLIKSEKISHIFLPPAVLGILEPNEKLKSLKVVVTGGEPISKNVVQKWLPYIRLLSAYGPSEATICSHLATCTYEWDDFLGELLPERKEKLFPDENENTFELWLGGKGLALEYIQDPQETFSKFIWADGERWYRTGDLVYKTPKGLKFLRRKDKQIKHYGNRLELEELEKVAQNFPEVLFCHPIYLAEPRILVLVYYSKQEISKAAWLEYLKNHFPSYLLPQEFLYLPNPILNKNGKWNLDEIYNWSLQQIFFSKLHNYTDSLHKIKEMLQVEKFNEIKSSSLSKLGAFVYQLKKEMENYL